MNDPTGAHAPLRKLWSAAMMPARMSEWLGYGLSAVLYPIELLLTSLHEDPDNGVRYSSSSERLIWKRAEFLMRNRLKIATIT